MLKDIKMSPERIGLFLLTGGNLSGDDSPDDVFEKYETIKIKKEASPGKT